ncbi:nickel pincer cofactor biosynthesis protein LarC [Roseisolibacter sp. H3M3-2]|uniref:nickel pincer cofactor biosynthesis protein LarC n=1 Tax=Roseisolibacter sp. H3M3-2 TaxID=3031323 RepID=UPI0023DB8117|nr:nickel pincer cofactor biosynthesis protein LarC [Roseisolibacter sp. H3M3-2]MDF1502639.1 nickel pincer cofactor biosynthesis protein LarC [Roseisolibacter sp. H3M3-2]
MSRGTIAILDPYSGIAGDMLLGALVAVGLDPDWLKALPATLGLDGVTVDVRAVQRVGIGCVKVDFDIPPQPHGRHLSGIRKMIAATGVVPEPVREAADRVFTLIAEQEAEIHGTTVEKVHLHEVGAVDAILDVVGGVWGLHLLGVTRVHCGPIQLGDGFVRAAHGVLPVPAPATMRILEGLRVRPGPDGAGELVTPTGAALARVLSAGPAPREYVPRRSGFGAGTKEFDDRANALRVILAEADDAPSDAHESLVVLAADVDDMPGEALADAAEALRDAGALDVVLLQTVMKKGRPGVRVEVLARPEDARELESRILVHTTTIGVRHSSVARRALPRTRVVATVDGQRIAVKASRTPDGATRYKAEHDDVAAAARATGRPAAELARAAVEAARAEQG